MGPRIVIQRTRLGQFRERNVMEDYFRPIVIFESTIPGDDICGEFVQCRYALLSILEVSKDLPTIATCKDGVKVSGGVDVLAAFGGVFTRHS